MQTALDILGSIGIIGCTAFSLWLVDVLNSDQPLPQGCKAKLVYLASGLIVSILLTMACIATY